jgi:phosphoribosylformimino-5-aminoimidazole carboxamide ribotide isomerase
MIEIIPAIDIIDGACVRLRQGRFDAKTIYHRDPVLVAQEYEKAGLRRLHCVDLDGARKGHLVNKKTLEAICSNTTLKVDVGGGIGCDADIKTAFALGAGQVTAGSIAVRDPQTVYKWLQMYGAERMILGADFKDGYIAVSGWQKTSSLDLFSFLEDYVAAGIQTVISTDISRDGMLSGSAVPVYKEMKRRWPDLYVIASGGISSMDDIAALDDLQINAVIVGKSLYEGRITMEQIREYMGVC